ncbi:MAG: fluoride efflux transporter CrcB [Sphingomonadales bacterium]|nr:MAG: fluoride efflux transporter CrcB [Sphingomonadales bacterium]TNF05401.1 MAG: fluoride efflux transporter CrcB [Sphingomonadales bacterium]
MHSLFVMLGGAVGALGRYQLGRLAGHMFGLSFPYGTLGANVIGGFLMGALAGWLARFGHGGEPIRLLLAVGLMGGFTTFSSFSLEIVLMMERGQVALAGFYAAISVIASVAALFAGLTLMRAFA